MASLPTLLARSGRTFDLLSYAILAIAQQAKSMRKKCMGILFGLTAAVCWGVADFVVTRVARDLGVAQAFFYVQMIGRGLIGLLLVANPAIPAPTAGMWMLVVV